VIVAGMENELPGLTQGRHSSNKSGKPIGFP
jgi:hypothetical protein